VGKKEGIKILEDTVMIWALAANKSISDAWSKVTEEATIPWKSDFVIRTEMLWFFLQMMARYAFEISHEARATLQDELVPATIQRLITTSFDRSHVDKGVNVKELDARMFDEALEQFNEAEMDYSSCKRLGVDEGDFLREETILGKLAARINSLTGQEANVELRLLIWATAVESLGKSGLKEQVRKLIDEL
jgi:hypothetical protein